jgi:exonuclease SbcD
LEGYKKVVRILHTADVHLGRRFPSLGKNGGDYRNQLLRTFEKIGDLAISERVSLLLIAGDLFDSNRVYGITIGKVLSTFKKLETAGIQVGILPGTHDSFDGDSIYRFLKFPANVTVFTPEHSHRTYENFDLTVYGRPPAGDSWGKSPIKGLSLVRQSKFHIGMAHCSVRRTGIIESDEMLLDESEIADSGLDYLALGHWHAFQDFSRGNTRACYCGSPEPLEIEKKDNGNVVMVTVSDKNNVDFSRVHVGTKKCEVLPVDVSPAKSASGIMEMIEARADPNLILEAVLNASLTRWR